MENSLPGSLASSLHTKLFQTETMTLPKQTPPVKRPHFTQPALAVDVESGSIESLVRIRMDLLHGANYNDPAVFAQRSYNRVMHSGWSGFGALGQLF